MRPHGLRTIVGVLSVSSLAVGACLVSLPLRGWADEPSRDDAVTEDRTQPTTPALSQAPAQHRNAPRASPYMTTTPKKKDNTATLEKKLDEILQNQQALLKKFDAVMEELRIIKVRATARS